MHGSQKREAWRSLDEIRKELYVFLNWTRAVMHSNFVEFDFGKLHYLHSDTHKEKTLLLLHPFNSSAASFLNICNLIKDSFNLYCLDFPGHGLSEHLDVHKYSHYYSLAGLTAVLIEFVNRLKLKNLFILGSSIGGNAVVRALPSLKVIEGLVLMGTIQAKTKNILFDIIAPKAPLDLLFKKKLSQDEIEVLTRAYIYSPNETAEEFKQMSEDIRKTDGHFRQYFSRNLEIQDWVNEIQILKHTPIPLIYILGLEDGFINPLIYKKLLLEEGFQETQINSISEAGHAIHLNKPKLCAQMITKFVNSVN